MMKVLHNLFKTNLDEMQEQTLRGIEGRSFWLMWTGLLITMTAEGLMGFSAREMAGEFILFMLISAYTVAECLRCGIWDRRLKPSLGLNLIGSAIAGLLAAAYSLVRSQIMYKLDLLFWEYLMMFAITFVSTFVLTFIVMQLMTAIYKKRHNTLENEAEDDDK